MWFKKLESDFIHWYFNSLFTSHLTYVPSHKSLLSQRGCTILLERLALPRRNRGKSVPKICTWRIGPNSSNLRKGLSLEMTALVTYIYLASTELYQHDACRTIVHSPLCLSSGTLEQADTLSISYSQWYHSDRSHISWRSYHGSGDNRRRPL